MIYSLLTICSYVPFGINFKERSEYNDDSKKNDELPKIKLLYLYL